MGLTGLKYGFLACFRQEQMFFEKTKSHPFGFSDETRYSSKL
jgi:hypothetical protein